MYVSFSKVDLVKDHAFCPIATTLATIHSLRRALIRRAVRIQHMHASRLYTRLPEEIPQLDAQKYSSLIDMSPCGDYTLQPLLQQAITHFESELKKKRELAVQKRSKLRRKRRRLT